MQSYVPVKRFVIILAAAVLAGSTSGGAADSVAGQALLAALHPLPKGIRLLGLGLHNLCEGREAAPLQLGLAI